MSLSRPRGKPAPVITAPVDDLSPILVERRIQEFTSDLDVALEAWRDSYGTWKDAEREYDVAFAEAKIAVSEDVPYNDRGQHAVVATVKQRQAKDVAQIAHEYAERRLAAVRAKLSAWQSIGKSVTEAYRNAGRL